MDYWMIEGFSINTYSMVMEAKYLGRLPNRAS